MLLSVAEQLTGFPIGRSVRKDWESSLPLSAQEQEALTALAAEKGNTGSGLGARDFWCVGCIIAADNTIVRQSMCYRAGNTGGGAAPEWFWGINGRNDWSSNDSECKVLAGLEAAPGGAINGAGNRLVMYSAKGPCGSCKKVIKEFRRPARHPIPQTIIFVEATYNIPASHQWRNGTTYGWEDAQREDGTMVGTVRVRRFP